MATTLVTYDEYAAMPDDGNRYEVIEGELCVVPAPNRKHQRVLLNLAVLLSNFVERNKLGQIYVSPFDVVLSNINVVQPDILYVSNGRLNILTDAGATGAPDLAVEVLSPSTRRRDRVVKLRLYENFGVDEYWMVDMERASIHVHRREGDKLVPAGEARETLETPLLPGLRIEVPRLFED